MKDDGRYLDIVDAEWIVENPGDYDAAFVTRAQAVVAAWPAKRAGLEADAKAEQERRLKR